MELGKSEDSAGWGPYCSASPNCASLSKATPVIPQGCRASAPRVRVKDLVKRASAPLKPFEHEVRRTNLRHVVQVVVEFRQVLHRDDPERLRRHLHVVVATFDGRWQIGQQFQKMLQRVHPALGADVAAADLKLVQEQRPLVAQGLRSTADCMSGLDTMTNLSRPTSRATMDARQLAREVFPLPLSL